MPIWRFTTKMKRSCTTSNPLNIPQGHDQIATAFMPNYGVDMKNGQNLTSGYFDAVMSK